MSSCLGSFEEYDGNCPLSTVNFYVQTKARQLNQSPFAPGSDICLQDLLTNQHSLPEDGRSFSSEKSPI